MLPGLPPTRNPVSNSISTLICSVSRYVVMPLGFKLINFLRYYFVYLNLLLCSKEKDQELWGNISKNEPRGSESEMAEHPEAELH